MEGLDRAKFVFFMGLLIKHLLQFSHVCGGVSYITLKLPSRINIFGSNKECNIIGQHFSE